METGPQPIALMKQANQSEPPCTVTASYSVKLRRPTPIHNPLDITSKVVELLDDRVKVEFNFMMATNFVLLEKDSLLP